MTYEVEVNGEIIKYGPYVEKSRFTDREWSAIYHKMVKENYPSVYADKKLDDGYLHVLGSLIDMEERYEALLELLPQSSFSKAGTHPRWVANAVEENTLDKQVTQSDVRDMIFDINDIEELQEILKEYFEIKERPPC